MLSLSVRIRSERYCPRKRPAGYIFPRNELRVKLLLNLNHEQEKEEVMAGRETRQYWIDQLSEYWESGFTIQEYCELKELSYESARRWIALLKKEREREGNKGTLDFVEVTLPGTAELDRRSGVKLYSDGVEILVEKNFDRETLSQVLEVLKGLPCSGSAEQ